RQWEWTGKVNSHVEEMYTGHELVMVYGHRTDSAREFTQRNATLYEASFKARYTSGIIQPAIGFIADLNYLAVAVAGRLRAASGALPPGDGKAVSQASRQSSQPTTPVASMANPLRSGAAPVARVCELPAAEAPSARPCPAVTLARPVRGRVEFDDVGFSCEK